jgi:uncharacterized protein YjiS (DUF1127 family)
MMVRSVSESIQIAPSQFAGRAQRVVLGLTLVLEAWGERRRQRHSLRELSDHVLKDIGIGRSEAEQEWRKPFWRA